MPRARQPESKSRERKEVLFKGEKENYVCKVASTIEEAKELIEAGFEYVCEFNEVKAFRKRK